MTELLVICSQRERVSRACRPVGQIDDEIYQIIGPPFVALYSLVVAVFWLPTSRCNDARPQYGVTEQYEE